MNQHLRLLRKLARKQAIHGLSLCHRNQFHGSLRYAQLNSRRMVHHQTTQPATLHSLSSSHRQVSINTYTPETTSQEDVIEALGAFYASPATQSELSQTDSQAMVILATPSFAPWLEEGAGFIDQVLRQCTKHSSWSGNRREIDVICACVDGLAPRPEDIRFSRGYPSVEGISFLYGWKEHILPYWSNDEHISSADSSILSSITFSKSVGCRSFDITLPLATTLFRNGRHSTLLVSKWEQTSAISFSKINGPIEKKNVAIQVCNNSPEDVPETHIPVLAVTPARRIVNGLGNIVRRLDFGAGNIGPASQELEESVNTVLKKVRPGPGGKIDIWALIVPPNAISKWDTSQNALAMNLQQLEQRNLARNSHDYLYVGHWLTQGATFCRVLSGGGGWGIKQGLLSLDPEMKYVGIEDTRFDFSDESLENQQASALGRLAKEGDYIQFFTSERGNVSRQALNPQVRRHSQTDNSTVLGAVPSTVDSVPSLGDGAQQIIKRKGPVINEGHFGCVSESGMFLHREDPELGNWDTKVDMPYSYLFYNSGTHPSAKQS